jgi:hypothetical protein
LQDSEIITFEGLEEQRMNGKKVGLCVVTLVFVAGARASAQVTTNVITHVLYIKAGTETGTAFTMEVDRREYLITAKHVVAALKPKDDIEIYREAHWLPVPVKVFRCDAPIDVAVLIAPEQLTYALSLAPNSADVLLGQDVYFAGYPFGLSARGEQIMGKYPIAMVKKGIVSLLGRENGADLILLDGYNNPGFSGGPIVYRLAGKPGMPFFLAGVISGFRPDYVHVTTPVKLKPGEDISRVEPWRLITLPDGQQSRLEDTNEIVPLNTGIVVGYAIDQVVAFIRKHPLGPVVRR